MAEFVVLIPVWNPTSKFLQLLQRLEQVVLPMPHNWRLLIVDDGSSSWPELPPLKLPVEILRHPVNQGKGAALKTGFQHILSRVPVPEAVITIDGDLQHLPEKIPQFVQRYFSSRADLVLGVRQRDWRTMPWHRIASNFLTSLIISTLIGQKVPDSQSGYRLIRCATLQQLLPRLQENRFHLESELIIRLGWMQGSIQTVPIPTIYNDAPSAIRNWPDTFNFISLIIRLIIQQMWGHV